MLQHINTREACTYTHINTPFHAMYHHSHKIGDVSVGATKSLSISTAPNSAIVWMNCKQS